MATMYYLCSDAVNIITHIIEENKRVENGREKVHCAALLIQRHGRGYLARKKYKRLHDAAIMIQKNVRRWLVRINMLHHILQQIDSRNLIFYDKMATKIQACWRGYKCRQVNRQIFLLRETQRLARENIKYMKKAKELKKRMEEDEIIARENESKKMVLFILFKLHHLLRTTAKPGILSEFDSNELSWIERLLKSLQFTTYMKELKKVYNNAYREPRDPPCMFKGRFKNCEKAYYQRYKGNDTRSESVYNGFCQKERFVFKKIAKTPYIPLITAKGTPIRNIVRDTKPEDNVSLHDFELTLRKAEYRKLVPDYFIDFWNKVSEVHEFPDFM